MKLPSISSAMLADKVDAIERSGAKCLVATDCSCLMHIEGGLRRKRPDVLVKHIAELLAEALQ